MLNLTIENDMLDEARIYDMLFQAGFTKIYCSHTGLMIGAFSSDEIRCFIDLQMTLNPFANEDEIFDACALAVIPASSRPSPLFQNMTPKSYRQLAISFPEHLFRYLSGKLVFERFSHSTGHTNAGGKVEWLKSLELVRDQRLFKSILDSLIRIDAIFSVRKCFLSHEVKAKLESIRNEWPGFNAFANFVFELESSNITRLADRNVELDGNVTGNKLAHMAAIHSAANVDSESYMAAYNARKQAEALNEAVRSSKAKENMLRINQAYAANNQFGSTEIHRGAEAVIGLAMAQADSQGAPAEGFILKALATYDFTKSQTRTLKKLEKGGIVEDSKNTRTPKVKKAPKISINIDLSL